LTWLNCSLFKLFICKLPIKNLSSLTSSSSRPWFRRLRSWSHACTWCLRPNVCLIDSVVFYNLTFWPHDFHLCYFLLIKFRVVSLLFKHLIFVVVLSFCKCNIHLMHALDLLNLVFHKIINDLDRDWIVFVNMVLCSDMISMLCNYWTFFAFN